jgi:hypothetical protein
MKVKAHYFTSTGLKIGFLVTKSLFCLCVEPERATDLATESMM